MIYTQRQDYNYDLFKNLEFRIGDTETTGGQQEITWNDICKSIPSDFVIVTTVYEFFCDSGDMSGKGFWQIKVKVR